MGNKSLLPISTEIERVIESHLTLPTNRFNSKKLIPKYIASQWDPYNCPVEMLPWLAWSLSVDNWQENWPEHVQRDVVANAVKVHKHKGTVGAVKRALASLHLKIEFFEWFEEVHDVYLAPYQSGEPNTFIFIAWANDELYTSRKIVLDQSLYDEIYRVTNQTKPQAAHFDFLIGIKLSSGAALASIAKSVSTVRSYGQEAPHTKKRLLEKRLKTAATVSRHRTLIARNYCQESAHTKSRLYSSGLSSGSNLSHPVSAVRRYGESRNEQIILAKNNPQASLVVKKNVPQVTRRRWHALQSKAVRSEAKAHCTAIFGTVNTQVARTYLRSEQSMPNQFIQFSSSFAGTLSTMKSRVAVRRLYWSI